ncbi:hypothetical protein RMSM_00224 [Rhodopirellula maiorica SM1]|uniref:Uncharacterized protein n=2 Tax=Novipirellula TaxID=2795426 RepID=M5S9P0_9BACT|nr:hypothetical protein RMSM_00224 [Rhodopirellula maiorica SM1]
MMFCLSLGCGGSQSSSVLDNASEEEIAEVRAAIEEEQRKMEKGFQEGVYDQSKPLPKQ